MRYKRNGMIRFTYLLFLTILTMYSIIISDSNDELYCSLAVLSLCLLALIDNITYKGKEDE